MRTAIYIRVSTNEQAEEGYSIESQKRRLIAYCDSQDWQIVDIYIDPGHSAKDLNRPDTKRMLADLKEGRFDIVLAYKLDRLTRSTSDCDYLLKLFESHKVMFQSATESFETRTATGRLFIRLIADIAQWERENIGERVRFGMEQKALEGKKPGGKYPFGYGKDGSLIKEEAETLRELRRLYMVERLGMQLIARRLNLKPETKRRGSEWTASTVALTLENPFYAGIIQFGSKLPDGSYPQRKRELRVDVVRSIGEHTPVWTQDEYNEHLALMRSRTDGGYSRKLDYWFSSLLRCGKCGSSMYGRLTTVRRRKDGSIVRTPYYVCSKRKANGSCNMPMLRQCHIEHLVLSYIRKIKLEQELLDEAAQEGNESKKNQKKALAKAKRELEAIKERTKKWQYAFVNDLITADDLRERLQEEEEKRTNVEQSMQTLQEDDKDFTIAKERLGTMAEEWPKLDALEKQEMLRIIFEKITIYTELENVKGVKNAYFPAHIEVAYH